MKQEINLCGLCRQMVKNILCYCYHPPSLYIKLMLTLYVRVQKSIASKFLSRTIRDYGRVICNRLVFRWLGSLTFSYDVIRTYPVAGGLWKCLTQKNYPQNLEINPSNLFPVGEKGWRIIVLIHIFTLSLVCL